ncbi:MAG: hypothetical protein M1830_000484 [Pleopsidium flavum]|nr:MAG: hypothetical protein M1830_000484 [Pleopsidium flavum]
MDTILGGLNAAQRNAVTSPAHVLQILAPPGSGKTKTLTARVAFLLLEGYQPWNILCLTFTIKSCREMRERIAAMIGTGLEAKIILGTFHSVCRRYLVSYGHLIGIQKHFGIADSSDSSSIIKATARARISRSKAHGLSHTEFSATSTKNVEQQEFAQIFAGYESALANANLLDYDDLLLRCVDLLRQYPACVSNVEAVLIDEFQDTNLVQFDLMRLFAGQTKRITIVGDPDQSIYGFRSAEIKNLKRMRKQYPDTLVVLLEENYRSSGAILITALEVIQQDESRPRKALLPTHCVGTSPVLRKLPSAAIEASWIASEIQRSIHVTGKLLTYADFAILLRSASLSRHIESAMGKAGIPYRMVGGHRFFDRVEIKTLLDYLRTISQPDNSDALARIINVPPRRIGESTIKALLEEAEAKQVTLWKLVREAVLGHLILKTKLTKSAEQGISSLINIVLTLRKKLMDLEAHYSPRQLLEIVIKKLAFQEYIEKSHPEDHEARWANVEELVAQAADAAGLESAEGDSDDSDILPDIEGLEQQQVSMSEEALSRFLAQVALSTELKADDDEGSQQKVTISTIHAAKGLEWPVIFIPAAYEGSIPHSRAEDTDEERRLLYVAMTRAKALLYMSCPTRNSQREQTTLSSFLSVKSLASHLDCKGPSLTFNVIQSIAQILHRLCPSEADIIEGCKALQSIEDDVWPTNGEEDPEEDVAGWDGTGTYATYQQISKRRRVESNEQRGRPLLGQMLNTTSKATNPSITMQKGAMFSVSSTTLHTGFVSAGSHFQDLAQQEAGNRLKAGREILRSHELSNQSKAGKKKTVSPTRYERSTKSSQPREGQGNLFNFFTKTGNGDQAPRGKSLRPKSRAKAIPQPSAEPCWEEAGSVQPKSISSSLPDRGESHLLPREPMLPIPQSLAEHRLRAAPISTLPRHVPQENMHKSKQYLFLSSSPPPIESFHEEAEAHDGKVPIEESHKHCMKTVSRDTDIRSATAFHITSTAQVQCAQTNKKTLGVRRSMNGWTSRGGHSFSVPGRVEPTAGVSNRESQT